jgi:hypothetical protein
MGQVQFVGSVSCMHGLLIVVGFINNWGDEKNGIKFFWRRKDSG